MEQQLLEAMLKRAKRRAEGDIFGTCGLRKLADDTAQFATEWQADGCPADRRWILATMVEACRMMLDEIKGTLHVARFGAPGLDNARQDWLTALNTVRPLLDDFPPDRA